MTKGTDSLARVGDGGGGGGGGAEGEGGDRALGQSVTSSLSMTLQNAGPRVLLTPVLAPLPLDVWHRGMSARSSWHRLCCAVSCDSVGAC